MLVYGLVDGDGTISMEMLIVLAHLVSIVAMLALILVDFMLSLICGTQQVNQDIPINGLTIQMEIPINLPLHFQV